MTRSTTRRVKKTSTLSYYLPFHSGPSLEHIPDDVFNEILSHLPTLTEHHTLVEPWGAIPSGELARTPVLRALSQTSQLLRSRFLAMAWQNLELCSAKQHRTPYYQQVIANATLAAMRVLRACPHLLSLIQTVSVILTACQPGKIIPRLAAYLSKLPNLTAIHVVSASPTWRVERAIKKGFQGRQLLSVRKISLPSEVHGIIESCPNLEEVVNISERRGVDSIIQSLIEGNCRRVSVLKGMVTTHLGPLVKLLPDLRHLEILNMREYDVKPLAEFSLLDTIEIRTVYFLQIHSVAECTDTQVNEAKEILKANKSSSAKRVIMTRTVDDDSNMVVMRKVIKV